jgi:pyrroloquinoline quinone biosynthesis protein E
VTREVALPEPPFALLAEVTHRCPLKCPYCSNPLKLERASDELDTETWIRVFEEAAALGCLQVHLSGGEPLVRPDLERLVAGASKAGLYVNLITSGVLFDKARVARLTEAGLEHVQLSFQDADEKGADLISGFASGHKRKLEAARLVRDAGLPLTVNFVVHRRNAHRVEAMLELALALGAHRIEIANVQYYGWAVINRAALMPARAQIDAMTRAVEAARALLKGRLVIDYVVPDYYAKRPKACMGGWGRRFFNVTPAGKVLPCHAAESIPGLAFDSVRDKPLDRIWRQSHAFSRFRGTEWMAQPCRTCERREVDWGGCRCQALAITGDAARTDPACELSPDHDSIVKIAEQDSRGGQVQFHYRGYSSL